MNPFRRSGPIRRRRERGVSLSTMVVSVLVALLAMGGLVIDGGAQSTAYRECQQVATEAARAAQDAASLNKAAGADWVDVTGINAAANAVLAGHPGITHSVQRNGDAITVRTAKTSPTLFLSLIGINSLAASGEATVVLRPTGG